MLIPLGILNAQGAAAGAGAYDLLETQVLSSAAASVTFTGLGSYSDYKHLQFRLVTKDSLTFPADSVRVVRVRFNSDSGSNYAFHELRGNGSSVISAASTSQTGIFIAGHLGSAATYENIFTPTVFDLLDFASTSKNKTVRGLTGFHHPDVTRVSLTSGVWLSTNAVTSVEFTASGNYVTGSRFSLYGVK